MAPRADSIAIIDACYRPHATHTRWLDELMDVVRPLLDKGLGCGFSMLELRDGQLSAPLTAYRGTPHDDAADVAAAASLGPAGFNTLWFPPRPVIHISELLGRLAPGSRGVMTDYVSDRKVVDMLGMLGWPAEGTAFVLWGGVHRKVAISGHLGDVLHRIRLHVEAGLRLRLAGARAPDAILSPSGQLQHLEPDACTPEEVEGLAHGTRQAERARVRSDASDAGRSLAVWQALVEGRWSIVRRVDADRKVMYLAYANPPEAVAHRALNPREALVLDQYSRGLSGKHVAYALGVSQSAASMALNRAATRMGFGSRLELLRFASGMRKADAKTQLDASRLTAAEHHVLALVRQGLTNRAIAQARATSERTVGAQLHAILRKTRAGSRRALIAERRTDSD